jgi:tetraacyldisaccharide 4'-kinase
MSFFSKKYISEAIEPVLTDDGNHRIFSLKFILFLISIMYGVVVRSRGLFFKKKIIQSKTLPCKVVSIGNLTTGGTGKTPLTIFVVELLVGLGYSVAVISRGYKGSFEKTGGVVSDGRHLLAGPEQSGDEPFMMAKLLKNIPVLVGQKRFEMGMVAVNKYNPDVIVLDDGFQHLKLNRNLDFVLLDGKRPFGNGHMLPRGPLREPITGLSRGDAFVFTRSEMKQNQNTFSNIPLDKTDKTDKPVAIKPVFSTRHVPYISERWRGKKNIFRATSRDDDSSDFSFLEGSRVWVFSGIANNEDFLETVKGFHCAIAGSMGFPDHHSYDMGDMEMIIKKARDKQAGFILTTQKDYVRLENRVWPIELVVIGITISFGKDLNRFRAFLHESIDTD